MNALTVSIVQNSAGSEVEHNLERVRELLSGSAGSDIIVLPEVFAYRGKDTSQTGMGESLTGKMVEWLSDLAREHQAWVLAGTVLEKDGDQLFNTSVLMNREGEVTASYRKIHLFESHLPDQASICEADIFSAGDEPVQSEIEGWNSGLAICYDLRFPELFRHYANGQADVIFIPSNFTYQTGRDHWCVLVRARAIENQCFVVAPCQCGKNPITGLESYGHSMMVDPWGRILVEAGEDEEVITATLDPRQLQEARDKVPALRHRRL